MTANALRFSSALSRSSHAPQATGKSTNTLPSSSQRTQRTPTSRQPVAKRRPRPAQRRLQVIPDGLAHIDYLMIQHGQLECGRGAQPIRPIVPRCMTALPENLTEFLESLLPSGY
jgi:hypothetical protein